MANRPMSQMRKLETKEALFRTRKRILKYLVLGFMRQEGLMQSAETFVAEAAVTNEYQMCDNVDLDIILQDYCSYYMIRFNKQPQFCKKVEEQPPARRPQTRKTRPEKVAIPNEDTGPDLPATFTITKLLQENTMVNNDSNIPAIETKPLASFLANASSEKKEIVDLLYQNIIRPSGLSWDDIKGLDTAKNILMESIVYPVRYPELFTGLVEPWRGVLLHGPPGSGKTMLARAVADQSGCVFFNITCSTLVNKWRGDSEKIIKVLFELASYYSPSVIFMDEVDSLVSSRSREGHEASRRLCSQLLMELDGVRQRDGIVFLLVNSNMPWDIDPALLRRLEKRIFIPLPDFTTRVQLFETYISKRNIEVVPKIDFEELAEKTAGYSGSDIKLTCKEALMGAVRKTLTNMNDKNQRNRIEKICLSDILTAIEKTKPVSKNLSKKHEEWQREMGST